MAIKTQEGVRALFRGIGPTLVGALPYEGIKFGIYDYLKRQPGLTGVGDGQTRREHRSAAWSKACCGAAASMFAHIVTYPNDTIRRRMQLQGVGGRPLKYTSYVECVRLVCRNEGGWRALYRGLSVAVARSVPNTCIQFGLYELAKSYLTERRQEQYK